MKLYCVSENQKKLDQYKKLQEALASSLLEIVPKGGVTSEIQSVSGEEVILDKIMQTREITVMPFIVDDVSLLVKSNAYPGALIKHILKNNTLKTLSQFLPEDTSVTVVCYLGYFDGFNHRVFRGEVHGITCYKHLRTDAPLELDTLIYVNGVSLGALGMVENHRGRAFSELVKYIQNVHKEREEHNKEVAGRWDKWAEKWQSICEDEASYVNHEDGYNRFNTEVKRILPLISGKALDIGCGDGEVTRLVTENSGINSVIGIDISPEMIRMARKKTTNAHVYYESGVFSKVDDHYNLVTSRGVVLSHMHGSDVVPTLLAMAEALAVDGYLVFDYISNIANNDDVGRMHKNQFSKEWIVAVLAEAGLVNVSCSGSDTCRVSILVFHKPMSKSLYFSTSNATKVLELKNKCKNHTIHLAHIDVPEIKHDDIVTIAKDKAKKSYDILRHPVIVTDGGIYITALNGFPGANSKQAAVLLGPKKLLDLMANEMDRSAVRRNCMVFYDGQEYKICVAEVPLLVSKVVTESEYQAYPLDAILIPVHEKNKRKLTYKQMPVVDRVKFTELPFFEEFIVNL